MAICKDPNEVLIAPLSNTVASDGTLLPEFSVTAIEQYSNAVAADIESSYRSTLIRRLVEQYGEDAFRKGLQNLNSNPALKENLDLYPELNNRLDSTLFITPIEYASYLDAYLYTPESLNNTLITNTTLVKSQLNNFYKNNFTQSAIGSFCSLMPSVFSAISDFFNFVEDASAVFADINDFITNFTISGLIGGLLDRFRREIPKALMKQLINRIKKEINDIINQVVNNVRFAIENLTIESIVGEIETFVNEEILYRFQKLKEKALAFFDKENIDSLLKKVDNLISYAVGVFKDPSLDEIQFLVYRFCSFASNMENAINATKTDLSNMISNYRNIFKSIQASSNLATAAAVTDGAIRYSKEERIAQINIARERFETAGSYQRPPTASEIDSIPTWEQLNSGTAGFQMNVTREDWEPVVPDVKRKIVALQRSFGRKLIVISAHRTLEEQTIIYLNTLQKRGLTRAEALASLARGERIQGVAFPSNDAPHVSGRALDIKWSGINIDSREEFIRKALEVGFLGIGRYGIRFVHVDINSRRSWGS